VVPAVLAPDAVPEPGLDDLVDRVHDGKAPAAAVRGIGGEHRQQDQDAHLQEDEAARASVLAAMQLQVQRAVDPGDPDQGEDDGELGHPPGRDMLGQVVGRLANDGHIDQVVISSRTLTCRSAMTSPWARGGRQNHRLKRLGISLVMASVDHLSIRADLGAVDRGARQRLGPGRPRQRTVRRLAIPDVTTTVLTLTLTGLAADSWLAGGRSPRAGRRLAAVGLMAAGALAGALLLRVDVALPVLAAAAVVIALVAVALRLAGRSVPMLSYGPWQSPRRPEG
jgi:hypothetical protein